MMTTYVTFPLFVSLVVFQEPNKNQLFSGTVTDAGYIPFHHHHRPISQLQQQEERKRNQYQNNLFNNNRYIHHHNDQMRKQYNNINRKVQFNEKQVLFGYLPEKNYHAFGNDNDTHNYFNCKSHPRGICSQHRSMRQALERTATRKTRRFSRICSSIKATADDNDSNQIGIVATKYTDPLKESNDEKEEEEKIEQEMVELYLERQQRLPSSSKQSFSSFSSSSGVVVKKKTKLSYSRPSAAIERGSGFFVPGLEGSKVKYIASFIVFVCTTLNHYYYYYSTSIAPVVANSNVDLTLSSANALFSVTSTEVVTILYTVLLFIQASIESKQEQLLRKKYQQQQQQQESDKEDVSGSEKLLSKSSSSFFEQIWHVPVDDNENLSSSSFKNKVEWAASTLVQLTPSTDVLLLSPYGKVYSLSRKTRNDNINKEVMQQKRQHNQQPKDPTDEDERFAVQKISDGCSIAFDILSQSSTGRVALPIDHIVSRTFFGRTQREVEDSDENSNNASGSTPTTPTTPTRTATTDNNNIRCVLLQEVIATTSTGCNEIKGSNINTMHDSQQQQHQQAPLLCWLIGSNQLLPSYTRFDLEWIGRLGSYIV